MEAAKADPLNVMIAGAPASGKGTQCELIKAKVSSLGIWVQPCTWFPFFHDALRELNDTPRVAAELDM